MNSRERVLKAVNFEKPDRIPIDIGALRASGINAVVYDRLKKQMGIGTPTKIHDTMQILAEVEMEVIDRLGGDVVPLDAGDAQWASMKAAEGIERKLFCGLPVYFAPQTHIRTNENGSWDLLDKTGSAYAHMPKDGFYFDFIKSSGPGSQIDPKAFKPRTIVPDEELAIMAQRGKYLYDNTDKAVLGWGASITLLGLSALLGTGITQGMLDEWLCMLMAEKDTAHEMMDRDVDATIDCIKLYHQAVGSYCFAWGVGADDAGTQRAGLISPDLFAEMIKPHYKKLCDWVHKNTNWKTYLHSCGSIYHYIPQWIEAGIDIINPVQISAADMSPEQLMRDFGGKVVFWGGGCDTQKVLPLGTPQEIREHVRYTMQTFGCGSGGYVFTQVHNIQQNVPVENVEAMFEAARQYGGCR